MGSWKNFAESLKNSDVMGYHQKAIEACVYLSHRYISDKFLPDKAIDILDEVGSRVHIHNIHVPEEIVKLEKNISALRKKKEAVIAKQKFEEAAEMRDKERKMIAKLNAAQEKWDNSEKTSRPIVTLALVSSTRNGLSRAPITRILKPGFQNQGSNSRLQD